MKAIVVGSGIGGLSAALRLNKLGFDVDVYEANAYPGGKLAQIELGGYRFDAGPSLFTLPHLVDELFELYDLDPRAYFNYEKLDEICQYFWQDGTELSSYSTQQKFIEEAEEKLGVHRDVLKSYLNRIEQMYQSVAPIFLERPLHKASTYFKADIFKALSTIPKLGLQTNLNEFNQKLLREKHLTQLFNRMATYNGSSPYRAQGIFALIGNLEHNQGAYFPKGGMYKITQSLTALAQKQGIQFHFNSKVSDIVLKGHEVIGVNVNGEMKQAEVIVSNVDVEKTYDMLPPAIKIPKAMKKAEKSSSGLIFYWGMNDSFEELGVHNIFFAEDYKAEFDYLFKLKKLYADPTIYVHISCKKEQADAPKGKENWFVMVNVPAGVNITEKKRRDLKEIVCKKISKQLNRDVAGAIECEDFLDPTRIETRTGAVQGALYGASSNSKVAAFLRHQNETSKVKGLFFCGGSVHPGGGVPLSILSGKIASDLIKENYVLNEPK